MAKRRIIIDYETDGMDYKSDLVKMVRILFDQFPEIARPFVSMKKCYRVHGSLQPRNLGALGRPRRSDFYKKRIQ